MKKICFLVSLFFLLIDSAFGQGGTWTWISGDSALNSSGVYGTQGVPSVSNHPPGVYEAAEWKDKQGNFWIYGGDSPLACSDLWKYNPITNEWTWVKGDGQFADLPVFGIKGVSNLLNTPGYRESPATWVDTSGALWLYSGYAYNSPSDLWKYDIGTNEWTWITGDTLPWYSPAVYSAQGVPDSLNTPGTRELASAWIDSLNNLWLYGGEALNIYGNIYNDVWKYDIVANEWTWMKGSDSTSYNKSASYGSKGVSAPGNDPGGRYANTYYKDKQGNFWIIGGAYPSGNFLNDVWKYDLSISEWTWMSGPNIVNEQGNYSTNCLFNNINVPKSRDAGLGTTDNCNSFWLFAGGDDNPANSLLNDLWVFDPQQLNWNWLSGSSTPDQPGNYGTLGIASPSNMAPSRGWAEAWWGNDNKFYTFGGFYWNDGDCYADLWVYNPDTNCVPLCAAAVLKPVASFSSSDTSICAYDCINFTDLSTNNPTSWQWYFAGAIDSISTAQNPQNICYYGNAGSYKVTLIASNSNGSDTLSINNFITVNPYPPAPIITQVYDTLFCSTDPSYIYYQWYFDTTVISSGAMDTVYVGIQSGNYGIAVTNIYCCRVGVALNQWGGDAFGKVTHAPHFSSSIPPCGLSDGIKNYTSDNIISLSPNPATDEVLITGNWQSKKGDLTIFNMLGEAIYTEELNSKQETINCKLFPSGIYFVLVANESGRWVGRFVKE